MTMLMRICWIRCSLKSSRRSNQLEDVAEFFRTYKSLEGRVIVIDGWRDSDAVESLLESCIGAEKKDLASRMSTK